MKKAFSILAVSFASANAEAIFAYQSNIKSVEENFQYSSLRPSYYFGRYGMSHSKYVTEGAWEGRAEFYNGTHWGTICDDFFNMTAADVFCRSFHPQFGAVSWKNVDSFPYTRSSDFSDGYQKPILMDHLSCSGNENQLSQCSYRSVANCHHGEDVVVTCSGRSNHTTRGNYRLANPQNLTSNGAFHGVWGRAEVFNGNWNNGTWNQICDDDFTLINAKVLCRSLGLPFKIVNFSNAQTLTNYHGYDLTVKGPWYYSNAVKCDGTELSLGHCPYRSRSYCSHTEDVYVHCGTY